MPAARKIPVATIERGDRRALEDTAEETLSRALNTSYPRPLTLVFPRFHRDDEARLLGLCEAAQLGAWLRDRHDDDWFRNPRALIDLKHRFGQPSLAREGELTPTVGLARLV